MFRTDRAAAAALMGLLALTAGCSHLPQMHWPWHRKPPPPVELVHELVMKNADGSEATFPQFWMRNTLVIDLQSGGASGRINLQPRDHTLWPVRLAFRVAAGQFEALEVRAQQRVVLPVTATGSKPVDLELDPGVFIMKTAQITVAWGTQASGD